MKTVDEPGKPVAVRPASEPPRARTGRTRQPRAGWAVLAAAAAVSVVAVAVGVPLALRAVHSRGDQPAGTQVSADPTPGAVDEKRPSAHGYGSVPLSKARILNRTQTAGGLSLAWVLQGIDNSAPSIKIAYDAGDGDCIKPRGIYVHETSTSVLLESVNYWARPRGSACASRQDVRVAEIKLAQPLGKRSLVHATLDSEFGKTSLFE